MLRRDIKWGGRWGKLVWDKGQFAILGSMAIVLIKDIWVKT